MNRFGLGLLGVVLLAGWQTAVADDAWYRYFHVIAGAYEIHDASNPEQKFRLQETPITKWSQPVRGGSHGSVYLWTLEKRPAVIGCFFIWPNGEQFGLTHELQSLRPEPVRAQASGATWKRDWDARDGIEWLELSGDRSLQDQRFGFRQLARAISVQSRNADGKPTDLRLLARPLYRYELTDEAKTRGALFGFVDGTDLEAVVIVESQATESDGTALPDGKWRCAFGRLSDYALRGAYEEREIWSVPAAQFDQQQSNYYCGSAEYLARPPAEPAGDDAAGDSVKSDPSKR